MAHNLDDQHRGFRRLPGAMVIVGALALLVTSGCAAAQPTAAQPEITEQAETVVIDDPSIGPEDAPITIVEYGDFSCPACKVWHDAGILKDMQAQYGDKIRFVWRDYAVLTPQSRGAAEAARCAHDQGKFWEYHDVLYTHYPALGVNDLKKYAAEMGLDTAQFNECLDTEQHFEQVANGLRDGMDHGFFGTPAFLVNDQRFAGGPPLATFQTTIDAMLAPTE